MRIAAHVAINIRPKLRISLRRHIIFGGPASITCRRFIVGRRVLGWRSLREEIADVDMGHINNDDVVGRLHRFRRRLHLLRHFFFLPRWCFGCLLFDENSRRWLFRFGEAWSIADLGCDRQPFGPIRQCRDQPLEFFDAAKFDRRFADDLVMDMQRYRIPGCLKPMHCRGKQIARHSLHNIFRP